MTLLRRVLRGRILGAQIIRLRHRDDVVARIDEMDLAGDAGREVAEQIEPGATELVERDTAFERRVLLLECEHVARVVDAGAREEAGRADVAMTTTLPATGWAKANAMTMSVLPKGQHYFPPLSS